MKPLAYAQALARALGALALPYLVLSLAYPRWPLDKPVLVGLLAWLALCGAYAGWEVARRFGLHVLLAGAAGCLVLMVDFVGLRGVLGAALVVGADGIGRHVQLALLSLPLALPVAFGVGAAGAALAARLGRAARPD